LQVEIESTHWTYVKPFEDCNSSSTPREPVEWLLPLCRLGQWNLLFSPRRPPRRLPLSRALRRMDVRSVPADLRRRLPCRRETREQIRVRGGDFADREDRLFGFEDNLAFPD